jgi:hypothetical protein
MITTIFLKEKSVYGNTLIYPNCETSNLFAKLIGTKTLNINDINVIKLLGYNVQIQKL